MGKFASCSVGALGDRWNAQSVITIVSTSAHEDFHANLVVNSRSLVEEETVESLFEQSKAEVSQQQFPEFKLGKAYDPWSVPFGSGTVEGKRFDFVHSAPHPQKQNTLVPLRRASIIVVKDGGFSRLTYTAHRKEPDAEAVLTELLKGIQYG